ncbi:MAG TPA: NifB/NifX family molybdenum-iron cluster-binding protein [Candidatus Limnocylindrales bacterium]|jgi:predicted Fe-Mo cluster-binding NifX family protein
MVVCVPVAADGTVDGSWGRAPRVSLMWLEDGAIVRTEEHEVGWDALHDVGTEGGHHARIARFLREHRVDAVVANHMGPPMVHMLAEMGIATVLGAGGDARAAVLAGVSGGAA